MFITKDVLERLIGANVCIVGHGCVVDGQLCKGCVFDPDDMRVDGKHATLRFFPVEVRKIEIGYGEYDDPETVAPEVTIRLFEEDDR